MRKDGIEKGKSESEVERMGWDRGGRCEIEEGGVGYCCIYTMDDDGSESHFSIVNRAYHS